MEKILSIFILFLGLTSLNAQEEPIQLVNPSFEDMPRNSHAPRGWYDCSFPGETAVDIQPGHFEVRKAASDGMTYLGMVTRDNETYESVSQRLSMPLVGGTCYEFNVDLAYSDDYFSLSRTTKKDEFFIKPTVLRIWAGDGYCQKKELLAESEIVDNTVWKNFQFKLSPKRNHKFISFEAFYKTPTLFPYNGNLLVDNASDLYPMDCDDEIEEPPVASNDEPKNTNVAPPKPKNNPTPKEEVKPDPIKNEPKEEEVKPDPIKNEPDVDIVVAPSNPPVEEEPKILEDLAIEKIKTGTTIKIEKLDFEADTFQITPEMYPVLDEIYAFLIKNKQVVIEIGGHTNLLPGREYCDWLSENRAKAVTNYLTDKGIPRSRISSKGYGKRNPIIPLKTKAANLKNPRVEIKILSMGG